MPRKSDASRRSDVSLAKFALVEEHPDESQASAVTPAKPLPDASVPTPSIEVDTERASESVPPGEKKESKDAVTIEELNLPKSIITRLAKGVLPPNTQIQANAIMAMSKAATVFINHLANAANERTLNSNKKTIMPDDVFDALHDIEFLEFREVIEAEFKKFNEIQTTKRNTYRRKVAAAKKGIPFVDPNSSTLSAADADVDVDGEADADKSTACATAPEQQQQRSSKKQKPNNPGEDSTMDVDGEMEDAETEPEDEAEEEEEEGDDDVAEEDEEEDGGEDGEGREDDEMHDALEERERADGEDEALDNGEDSDS